MLMITTISIDVPMEIQRFALAVHQLQLQLPNELPAHTPAASNRAWWNRRDPRGAPRPF